MSMRLRLPWTAHPHHMDMNSFSQAMKTCRQECSVRGMPKRTSMMRGLDQDAVVGRSGGGSTNVAAHAPNVPGPAGTKGRGKGRKGERFDGEDGPARKCGRGRPKSRATKRTRSCEVLPRSSGNAAERASGARGMADQEGGGGTRKKGRRGVWGPSEAVASQG